MKYAKKYSGFVTGSPAGRDDGYPETKILFFDDLASLAADPHRQDEIIYEVKECRPTIYRQIEEQRKLAAQQQADEQRREKEAEFERLKVELGK